MCADKADFAEKQKKPVDWGTNASSQAKLNDSWPPQMVVMGNPRLVPEGLMSLELGYRAKLFDMIMVDAVVFNQTIEDIIASYETFDPSIMFQSTIMIPCNDFPTEGISYELKGLAPGYSYYVYGEIADFANENWLAAFSFGGYKSLLDLEKVEVTSTAAVVDIDLTLLDVQ